MTSYKINTQKSVTFLCSINNQYNGNNLFTKTDITTTDKMLGINSIRNVQVYMKNIYVIPKKHREGDLHK